MIKNIIENNEKIDINTNKIDKLKKLKEMFPNCVECFEDEDGNRKELINLDIIKNELNIKNIINESFGLNFLGKNYAKYIASLDTETILVPDEENNSKEENKNSENIYISGDNIDALKHLVKSYTGQIKCIYIDPPYNTGNDGFVYNDKFNLSIEKLIEILDINEEEAKRIYNMTNAKSNSHSAWLTFMYPRLYLAKQLLKDDGVIFISIDDNEQDNLKKICNEIFGEENFIIQIAWQNLDTVKNDAKYFSGNHEYILMFAKNLEQTKIQGIKKKKKQVSYYKNSDNDPRGPYLLTPLHAKSGTENGIYTYIFSNGQSWCPPQGTYPRYSKQTLKNLEMDNRILLDPNGIKIPQRKTFLSEVNDRMPPTSFWGYADFGSTRQSNKELAELIGRGMFQNPKPIKIIMTILDLLFDSNKDSLILDFFSGSATTAHAVMQLNAEDGGNRKFIMVQLPEICDEKSEAYKNGYKTVDEIGQERIRRAAKKIKEETNADIDYGFKHYTIKDVNADTLDKLEKFEPNYVISDGSILKEFGVNAVLTTWMNEDGYGLTDSYEKLKLADYTAYKCQNTIYLLNPNISDLFIKTLIEKYEREENFDCNRIVIFGYSFTLTEIQTLKDNLQQVKNIKGTNVEVITRY